ncbi:MAG: peptide/nickel transport system substrate-binding protein, partial [Chloroflexota bacterium]|nr:peptide/nickel transport system substrate-binding protein [Chloroflexota bacterium]
DANYCDPAYDRLYASSRTLTDLTERARIVKEIQAKAYTDSPYSVLWYNATLEAYRSDRWQGFRSHPTENGDIWGAWGFGPYGSRTTVAPLGAVEPSPSAAPTEPVASQPPASEPATPAPGGSGAPASPGVTPGPGASPTPAPAATATPRPTTAPSPAPSGGGTSAGGDSTPLIIGGLVAAALALGVLWWRRRAQRDDE